MRRRSKMNKLWMCVVFAIVFSAFGHAESDWNWFYDDEFAYSDAFDKLSNLGDRPQGHPENESDVILPPIMENKTFPASSKNVADKKIHEEVNDYQINNAESLQEEFNEDKDEVDDIDEYQIEDNRSEVKEDKQDSVDMIEDVEDFDAKSKNKIAIADDLNIDEVRLPQDTEIDYELLKQDNDQLIVDDSSDDLGYPKVSNSEFVDDAILEETKKILQETNEAFDEEENVDDDENVDEDNNVDQEGNIDEEENVHEEENEDDKVDKGENVDEDENADEEENFDEDENVDKNENVIVDENMDEDGNVDEEENFHEEENVDEDENDGENESIYVEESVEELDDTDTNLQAREENDERFKNNSTISEESEDIYEDTDDKDYNDFMYDINELRETWDKLKDDADNAKLEKEDLPGFHEIDTKIAEIVQEVGDDDYKQVDDKYDSNTFEDQLKENEPDDDEMDEAEDDEYEVESDTTDTKTLENDNIQLSDIKDAKVSENSKIIQYVDDALSANDGVETTERETKSSAATTTTVEEYTVKPMTLEDIPNYNYSRPMKKKAPNDLIGSEEPKIITLNLDEPVVLTSPNYPSPYPSNTMIDWILQGEGVGIELNVTDFAINGADGHYVMIKPGRIAATGDDGLLLTHILNDERRFRFLDVDRMFIRFEARVGMAFRGFSITAKMIAPFPDEVFEEPESLPIGYPPHTLTVNLGGVSLDAFLPLSDQFRQIVADMATVYINANLIDIGLNTTSEVTQITSTAMCNHNWPQFESCVEVRFGVPLQYEEEVALRLDEDDLRDMWLTYSQEDPFAFRLRRLGITEFQVPNDSNVLMVWLVIAAGVVISMAMLAFALWRFSCFEDYTRMPAFSDTESICEKKTLDLYPTPHQTLPPLYADSACPWTADTYDDATRVDMGGLASRAYVRTEYEFDSEEEAAPSRDRYTTDV